ncbi:MAG: hypothetical protein QME51_04645 [Planctomycetota bacterium]|nr:hypothetical protein [Planctomycetota bacterium]
MVKSNEDIRRLDIGDFQYGLNSQDATHEILLNQSPDLQNVDLSAKGKIYTRLGTAKLSSTPIGGSPTGIYGAFYGKSKHLAASLTAVWKDMDGTPVEIKTGLTNNAQTYFEEWMNEVWVANGTDAPFRWDGTNTAAITTPPSSWTANPPDQIVEHENRLWSYDFSACRIEWSNADNGNDWTTVDQTGTHSFRANDGFTGTGIVSQKGGLVVFKQNSIYKIPGKTSVSFRFVTLYSSIGCIAPRSIVNIENRILFLAKVKGIYGIYALDDAGGITHLSHAITPTLANILAASENLCAAAVYKDKYVLSYPISGGWRKVNLYYKTGAFEFDNGNASSCYYNQAANLYGGSVSAGYTYQINTGANDDGAAIDSYVKTKDITFGVPEFVKEVVYLVLWAKASGNWSMNINFQFDGKTHPKTYKMDLGTKGSVETTRQEVIPVDMSVQGDILNIKFSVSTLNQSFELYKAALYYKLGQQLIKR